MNPQLTVVLVQTLISISILSPGPETHISMFGMAESAFLKAIFILILAIFAWLQKEAEKKHRLY